MAIMSRGKQSKKIQWNLNRKEREKGSLEVKADNKEITPEEHQERIKKLKEMGLIK